VGEFDTMSQHERAMAALDPKRKETTVDREEQVAKAAGLGPLHGGDAPITTALTWRGECPEETGCLISISRIWNGDKGPLPDQIPIECPVCGEEHMLPRAT
jgi:hypothetical protein